MITFDSQAYVFVSLADGPIVYYLLDTKQGLLYERKKVPLGTKPTTLTICHQINLSSISRTVLFACSDHPSVISLSNNKIVFSSVNLREIVCMCSFNSEYYGSSLTLVTDMGVLLGRIDDIQKLHVRSLILAESVRRIAFIDEEKAYILLTQYMDIYQTDNIIPISKQAHQKIDCITKIKIIEDLTNQQLNDVCNSIVILDQHTHEGEKNWILLREFPLFF
jgi:DNA damage-binding protein 1